MIRHCPYHHKMVAAGAKMVDRLGFAAPASYTSSEAEHLATRTRVGVFDVYYQVALEVSGPDATSFLDRVAVNSIAPMTEGMALYTSLCSDSGGMIDDLTIFRLGHARYWLLCTPSRVHVVEKHLEENVNAGRLSVINYGYKYAYLSVQGPKSRYLLQKLTATDLSAESLRYFRFTWATVAEVPGAMVSRTGYSGELGYELIYPSEYAEHMWDAVFSAGAEVGAVPCGLGALRSLRMEKKFPLYGADIDETTSPLEAGLEWTVKFDKGEFIGRAALLKQKQSGIPRRLCLLRVGELDCPVRSGDEIDWGGPERTVVRSAEPGYSVGSMLALAYLPPTVGVEGSVVTVITSSGQVSKATVLTRPVYDPQRARALA